MKSLNFNCLKNCVLAMALVMGGLSVDAKSNAELKSGVQRAVELSVPEHMGIGKVKVNKLNISSKNKTVTVDLNETYSYVPFTEQSVKALKDEILSSLGKQYSRYKVVLKIEGNAIEKYIVDEQSFAPARRTKEHFIVSHDYIKPEGAPAITEGLSGNNIAMWQSHGWYFEAKLNRWEWQRARIFQTVEDLYTQSYVVPFLMPMLQNAGAYVMSPRERDTKSVEIIIDAEGEYAVKGYSEKNGDNKWGKGEGAGFAYNRAQYGINENPFTEGSYRVVKAVKEAGKASVASWNAEIPADGNYAVYISYATLPNSAKAVEYTVNSAGDAYHFTVNQTMGGGTWIYLGHFPLKKGKSNVPVVTVSNATGRQGEVVTADAVKIGGGMGNIARKVIAMSENVKSSDNKPQVNESFDPEMEYKYMTSGYPRFTEGARYWLQWAGVPDSVYSPSGNVNDYTDDYRCRGIWVNYLAGGSEVLPKYKGLNIPIDLSFAFHTDAGTTMNDSIIGTLGIYYTNGFSKYANGVPRAASRKLTNLVMTNIVNDIRAQFEPKWMRRGMWDKSYFEARVPEVPAMLLELLSHQNFADMKYGLDPTFRFTVSRAIYKGMLQFIAERDGREYMVQPLPVNAFAITPGGNGKYTLTWKATPDTLSENSDAEYYIVYERINDGAFRSVATTTEPKYEVEVKDNDIHSYRIVAGNKGGVSFPSEVLALGVAKESKGNVLVVNGFTRVSAPDWFDSGEIAGFYDAHDHGVPYQQDISFIGSMFEYRRDIPWMDDDAAGFGASRANYETKVIAGNTFDYTAIHGEAIMKAGYSFVSSSLAAVESGDAALTGYNTVDLILGKQKETIVGRGAVPNRYKIYSPALQNAIRAYTKAGGNVFISGAYVASDLWDKKEPVEADKKFAAEVLGYKWRVDQASVTGEAYTVATRYKQLKESSYCFSNELNEEMYAVESPDSFYPADEKVGASFMRYTENNLIAGTVLAKDGYKTCVIGFPFETIRCNEQRADLMSQILNFFNAK